MLESWVTSRSYSKAPFDASNQTANLSESLGKSYLTLGSGNLSATIHMMRVIGPC